MVCWPRFVGFDGGGSGSWLAGEEREANFPRRRVTSLLSLLSSRPISTRYSDWEFTGGRFRRKDNSDFSWRMSSFIALISRDISCAPRVISVREVYVCAGARGRIGGSSWAGENDRD